MRGGARRSGEPISRRFLHAMGAGKGIGGGADQQDMASAFHH